MGRFNYSFEDRTLNCKGIMPRFYISFGKRVLDIVLVVAVLISLSWLYVGIILCYVVTLEFPVLYRSERTGINGTLFTMLKFRSLTVDSEKLLQDRQFWLGKILRFTNLDELPQLWNVLKGEMSIVGPRPLPASYYPLLTREQKARYTVLPGITGWAQVHGKNEIPWNEKFTLDMYYVSHLSFALDVRVLWKTVILVFSFKKDTSLKEEKLNG